MAKEAKRGWWRCIRIIFRSCRITVLFIILALVGAVLYLDRVGLPDFIKNPLVQKLHDRGLDLHFSRLRWKLAQGIVAENVFFGRTNDLSSPQLTLKEVELRLNYRALLKRQFQVDSLALRQGRLALPVISTNSAPRELSIEHIQTDLQLLTNDVWELDNLQAEFGGAKIQLTGALTNASAFRSWKWFHGKQPAPPGTLQNRLRRIADTLEKIHFPTPPNLKLDIRGDAVKMDSIAVRLFIEAPGAETPWGTANGMKCFVLLAPPKTNEVSRAIITFRATDAATRWAAITNLGLTLHLFSTKQDTNLVHADLDLAADSVRSRSNHAERVHFTAQWFHSLTNAIPLSGQGILQGTNAVTDWASATQFRLQAALLPPTNAPATDSSWAWWTNLAAYPMALEASADGVHSPKLDLDEVLWSGQWRAPDLRVDKLSAKLYGGTVEASATLNVATRKTVFTLKSDFDAQKISSLLTPMARSWIANYSWKNPPSIKGEGSFILPASVWTNRHPDWRGEMRPTLQLAGEFHVKDGAFRGVHALTADSHFSYSNMCWRLPDLVATRPEGKLLLFHESDERTKNYYFRFTSTLDPRAARPLLEPNQRRIFDYFSLTQPPIVGGEVWGRWHDRESIRVRARLIATNFTVRGESVDSLETDANYTNHILTLIQPRAWRMGTQELSAASLKFVFDDKKIFLTNGFSTADAEAVVRAIGPHAQRALEPYHFMHPPTVHAEGIIPMRNESDADLHFDVSGGEFQWWKLQVPHISGKIDWVGQHLSLKDVHSDFYLGKASGNADFEFDKISHSANYRFTFAASDANLHLLATDLADGKSNKLEGLLTGRLEVTNANSANWQSWQGAGRVELRDGLIWDIPIFGIFSPVLDTVVPGLGSSRARQGSATFTITNGVVDTDDLKIETLMARMLYRGTIDLAGNVDARMEAELFRNTWVVGPVLSLALWPVSKTFEYKITGSIHKPKSEPMFIPKILFFPLHPVQTIKNMMPDTDSSTNSPPGFGPLPQR